MGSRIRSRLKVMEGAAYSTAGECKQDWMRSEIAEAERQACLILAWVRHNKNGEPIDSVLPEMLRYVGESEAKRLLAMDYGPFYRAIGMPDHAPAKPVPKVKLEERAMPQIKVPGRWRGGR